MEDKRYRHTYNNTGNSCARKFHRRPIPVPTIQSPDRLEKVCSRADGDEEMLSGRNTYRYIESGRERKEPRTRETYDVFWWLSSGGAGYQDGDISTNEHSEIHFLITKIIGSRTYVPTH